MAVTAEDVQRAMVARGIATDSVDFQAVADAQNDSSRHVEGWEAPVVLPSDWREFEHEEWPLTKATARGLYDELGELEGCDDQRDFVDKFFQIEGNTWISDEPWHEHLKYEPSSHYHQLLHVMLPVLVRACDAEVKRRNQIEAMDGAPCR